MYQIKYENVTMYPYGKMRAVEESYITCPGVESASNRNEFQEYFLGCKDGRWVELTTLQPSCADCLEIWEPQLPGTFRVTPGL